MAQRRPVNEAKVAELMESIQSVGVLNPIVVVASEGETDGRRVRAAGRWPAPPGGSEAARS